MFLINWIKKLLGNDVYPVEKVREQEKRYRKWLKTHKLPEPTQKQLEWLDAEIGMFCHFGINTFHNKEWSDGTLPADTFNPKKLDCEQWVRTAQEMGANYMIVTAKHHDGFCLWQTKTTDYSVASSPWKHGKGDVVKEFVQACRKHNMKFGFYLSPWDRHEEKYGCYNEEGAYDEFYITQLTELLSEYAEEDEAFEIWFDGAGSKGHTYDWERIMGVCDKYQPNAMIFNMGKPTIRWVGNENGLAKEANWNVLKMEGDMMKMDNEAFDNVGMKLEECHGLGNVWIPAECDTTIRKSRFGRKHWFYHTDDEKNLQSLDDLLEIYHKSVGRGANLLLNISPNRQGLLPEVDVQRAREFGKKIKKMYSKPMFLWENQERNEKREIMIDLGKNLLFNTLMLEEAIKSGQRIREYHVEYRENNIWKKLSSGYSIGHKKIDRFKKKKGNAIRLKIPNSLSNPIMKRISLYNN